MCMCNGSLNRIDLLSIQIIKLEFIYVSIVFLYNLYKVDSFVLMCLFLISLNIFKYLLILLLVNYDYKLLNILIGQKSKFYIVN